MKEKIFKIILIIFIVFFLTLLLADKKGYYVSKTTKAKELTEEQIEKFEKDIKEGKEIDIDKYTININKDYRNNLSNNIYKISLKLEKAVDKTIKRIFKDIEKTVTN